MAAMLRHFRVRRAPLGDLGVLLLLALSSSVLARVADAVSPNVNLSQDAGSSRSLEMPSVPMAPWLWSGRTAAMAPRRSYGAASP